MDGWGVEPVLAPRIMSDETNSVNSKTLLKKCTELKVDPPTIFTYLHCFVQTKPVILLTKPVILPPATVTTCVTAQ